MRWFRSRVQLGTRAALFALGVQLTLSFGHLHVNDTQAGPVLASRVLGLMVQPRTEQVAPTLVLQHHPTLGVGAEPPVLTLPDVIRQTKLTARAEFASAAVRHSFFDARAPPNA
jgi:hypothetical protein